MSVWRLTSSTWPASAALRPRSSSAVGRSARASVKSSCIAWLAIPLVSASSRSTSGGAFSRAASRCSSTPVSDWLTSSWRSRATRARSSSIACSAALEVRRRSASRRSSMRRNASSRRCTSSVSERPSTRPPRSTPERARSARSIASIRRSRGSNRRWIMNRLTRTVSAIAKASTRPTVDSSPNWVLGLDARLAATTATEISSRFAIRTLVSSVLRRTGASANYRHRTGGWLSPAP